MSNSFIILAIVLLAFVDYSYTDQKSSNDDKDDVELQPLVCNKKEGGCIKGINMPGFRTKTFEAFLGIPFAEPPINNLRFANPKPVVTWKTTIIADTAKDACLQRSNVQPTSGSEDCLYLNIFRPTKANRYRKPLPVIVYIHGGGFYSGSANDGGAQFFMDTKEVILVTIAYRLGALGFLSTGDKHMTGNFGLKDQAAAIKWVNQNIKYFNGNPKHVTIVGESAGGSSVNFHLLSNLSKGLFHRAALLSGSSLSPWAKIEHHPLEVARKQAKYVGISNYKTLSTKQLTKELRKVNAVDLLLSGSSFKRFAGYPFVNFKIVIEDANDPNAFLTKDPRVLMKNGEVNYVPLLVSIMENEGFITVIPFLTNNTLISELNDNLPSLLPYVLFISEDPPKLKTKSLKNVIKYYLDGNTTSRGEEIVDIVNKAFTDYILVTFYDTIKLYTKYMPPSTPVNIIKFAYRGSVSLSSLFTTRDFGAVHGDDLLYYFSVPGLLPFQNMSSPEAKASVEVVASLIKFAKTGVPEKWVPIENCKYDPLNPKQFCDYQRIIKEGDDFVVKLDSYFNYKILPIWQKTNKKDTIKSHL